MSISQNFSNTRPSLNLNFARSKTLDPRITFSRPQTGNGVTYVGEDGLIKYASADEPRFDHDPVTGECLGLLVEEQRTNYFHGTQPGSGGTVSDGNVVGADGVIAKKFVPTAGSVSFPSINSRTNYTIPEGSQVNGGTVDISFTGYIAALADDLYTPDIVIQINTSAGNTNYIFAELLPNLSNGTVWYKGGIGINGVTELIEPQITLMPFGMYKITWSIRYTQGATIRDTVSYYLQCRQKGANPVNTTGVYTADGVNGFQYSCIQFEIGSFPTSYISTTTTSITRNPDSVTMTGDNFSDWYNQSEGTFYSQFKTLDTENATSFLVSDNSADNYIFNWIDGVGDLRFRVRVPGSHSFNDIATASANQNNQSALAYAINNFAGVLNGGTILSDSNGTLPTGINRLDIGRYYSGITVLNGTISQLTYYPVRLPNSTLQTLTK